MREQSYPPKRPNMAHFGAAAEQPGHVEVKEKMQAAGADGREGAELLQRQETPAPLRSV